MVAVANGKSGEVDSAILNRLQSYGYVQKTEDGYIPSIMVMRGDRSRPMPKEAWDRFKALRYQAQEIATAHYLFCREQIEREIPDFLKNNEFQIDQACASMFSMRGAVLEEALATRYLSYDPKGGKRMLGAYLVLT